MIIKRLAVGPIMANCFILGCPDTREAAVIDPGDEADKILMTLADEKLKVTALINTHGHFDHVAANKRMKEVTGAELMIHKEDAPMLAHLSLTAAAFGLSSENSPPADRELKDGDRINVGTITLDVVHTPGHTPGGISLISDGHAFVGDTLFAGSIGRTDLPGGDFNTLINSIKRRLYTLPDATVVHTGHGPDTTIANEKRFNPFVQG